MSHGSPQGGRSRSEGCAHGRWQGRLRSAAQTELVGCTLGQCARGGEVLALYGDLGSGKTTLVRGLARGLAVPREQVSSPSFVLIHEHRGRLPLIHADLFRLDCEDELQHIGLAEYVDGHAVVAIEWAEKADRLIPQDRLELRLIHHSPSTRDVFVEATGPQAAGWLLRTVAKLTRKRGGRKHPQRQRKER